jgi:hypothetical protein
MGQNNKIKTFGRIGKNFQRKKKVFFSKFYLKFSSIKKNGLKVPKVIPFSLSD